MSKIQPLPWGRDEYGSLIDATGERICLTGVAIRTGHVSDNDPCHANTSLLLDTARRLEVAQRMADALRAVRDNYAGLLESDYTTSGNPDPVSKSTSIAAADAALREWEATR